MATIDKEKRAFTDILKFDDQQGALDRLKRYKGFDEEAEINAEIWVYDAMEDIKRELGKLNNNPNISQSFNFDKDKVIRALYYGYIGHYGQKRKDGGEEYINHPKQAILNYISFLKDFFEIRPPNSDVHGRIKPLDLTDDFVILGLHDVLEDAFEDKVVMGEDGSKEFVEASQQEQDDMFYENWDFVKDNFGENVSDPLVYVFTKASKRPFLRNLYGGLSDIMKRRMDTYAYQVGIVKKTHDPKNVLHKTCEMRHNIQSLLKMKNAQTKATDIGNHSVICYASGHRFSADSYLVGDMLKYLYLTSGNDGEDYPSLYNIFTDLTKDNLATEVANYERSKGGIGSFLDGFLGKHNFYFNYQRKHDWKVHSEILKRYYRISDGTEPQGEKVAPDFGGYQLSKHLLTDNDFMNILNEVQSSIVKVVYTDSDTSRLEELVSLDEGGGCKAEGMVFEGFRITDVVRRNVYNTMGIISEESGLLGKSGYRTVILNIEEQNSKGRKFELEIVQKHQEGINLFGRTSFKGDELVFDKAGLVNLSNVIKGRVIAECTGLDLAVINDLKDLWCNDAGILTVEGEVDEKHIEQCRTLASREEIDQVIEVAKKVDDFDRILLGGEHIDDFDFVSEDGYGKIIPIINSVIEKHLQPAHYF